MRIDFSLEYKTVWGEELRLSAFGREYPMQYSEGGRWSASVEVEKAPVSMVYSYVLVSGDKVLRHEWRTHKMALPRKGNVTVRDRWTDQPEDSPLWSTAFTKGIFHRTANVADGANAAKTEKTSPVKAPKGNVRLTVSVPSVLPGEVLAVNGSGSIFADWTAPLRLSDERFPIWDIVFEANAPFWFKYVVLDEKTGNIIRYEIGENHFSGPVPGNGDTLVISDIAPVFDIRPWRGAGTAVPVFSLRTRKSFGTGEFNDIKALVDWTVETGQNVIQILPINDTTMSRTWQDSYPYNAVSSFALHPHFIHLPAIGVNPPEALRKELEKLPAIDYERVDKEKEKLVREAFARNGEETLQSPGYRIFVRENEDWLLPYSVFCVLRDKTGETDFSKWGNMAVYDRAKALRYRRAHRPETEYYCYVQYHLHIQLKEAVEYAHSKGVILKGDLPIGVSRTSADAWSNPSLYNLDSQAGAPPDAFSVDGQNWGFPTYNWDEMAKDGFAWWKARLRKMGEYFDAFRIDHILGFFRIWEIPCGYSSGLMGHFSPALPYSAKELSEKGFDVSGGAYVTSCNGCVTDVLFLEDPRHKGYYHPRISGQDTAWYQNLEDWKKKSFDDLYYDFFYHRHNEFWKETAMVKLPALLRSTGMLSCGEDLGMIPSCVPEVMGELNLLSLEIQRMPKDPALDFAKPELYPYLSVCATGTHDTSTLRGWWEEDKALTAKFFHEELHLGGEVPAACGTDIAEKIIRQHLESPSMLCILPLQDWLSIDGKLRYQGNPSDERINIPAIPRHYWRYRMHLKLEDLVAAKEFNARLKSLIGQARP